MIVSSSNGFADQKPKNSNFTFSPSGDFVFLHVTDIQENGKLHPRSEKVLRDAISKYKPSLVVLTGDNVDEQNTHGIFEKTIDPQVAVFKDTGVYFAVTFGNHDSAKKGPDRYTRQEQYDLYKAAGGEMFIDHDIPELTGTGSGLIRIFKKGESAPAFNIFLMDSGDYASGGYDGCHTDQIEWYEKVSGDTPCLWFQHIIVPDANWHGIFVPASETEAHMDLRMQDGSERGMKTAPGTTGELNEKTCPTALAAYNDPEHTFEGRTLYDSWLKTKNMKGAFFGHDHQNTFDGTDENGIRLATSRALTLNSYNDDNPGLRFFIVHADGSYETGTFSEKLGSESTNKKD